VSTAGQRTPERQRRGRTGGPAARAAGFTLVEVLLATVLLAAGLALAFATLVAATRTASRGESIAERSERMRAVEGFLRARLAGARPIAFAFDDASALPQRFVGEPDRVRFVADLPDYLGRGGPYLHDFAIEDDPAPERDADAAGASRRITLALTMVQAGTTVEESGTPLPPEELVDALESARFRYRALGEDGALGEWQDRWDKVEQLPLLVEVTLRDGDGRDWPPLVVRLPLAGSENAPGSMQ
jgi:general secretion pathway protein J